MAMPCAPFSTLNHTPLTRRRLLTSACLAPLVASCASDLPRYQHASITQLATELEVCSVAYAVVRAGKVQRAVTLSGCGAAPNTASPSADQPPQELIFQAASLTKPVAAYAALQLVIAGKLDLLAPVSLYLPEGYTHYHSSLARSRGDPSDLVPVSVLSQIPVRTLLNHTCGFPNWSAGALTLSFKPGERWQYSGEGYVLLQTIIEAITGQRFDQYMQDHVFTPLGMQHSSLVWRPALATSVHVNDPKTGTASKPRFIHPVAAASLYTTANDYGLFLSAVAANPALHALITQQPVNVDDKLGIDWGYGWGVERNTSTATSTATSITTGPVLWQWGNNPGFRTFTMLSPATGNGFALFTNSDRGMPLAVPLAHQVLPMEHNAFRFHKVG